MKYKNIIFVCSGLAAGLFISLSIKNLYNKLTELNFGNIIDYEDE
jgi:hypothetical protein